MATNYTSLVLTDGTATLSLQDGTNYALMSWSPEVARPRRSTIGNRCPYEDVEETISLSILGATPAAVMSNLIALEKMLTQAEQYARGDNVAAVTIQAEPQGVTAGAWKALVLRGSIDLPSDWADNLVQAAITGVTLRVQRRGLWTRSEYTSSTSGATAVAVKTSVTLTNPGAYGYASEIVMTASADEAVGTHFGYLFVSSRSNGFHLIGSGGGTNDAGNLPAGHPTNIAQLGPGASVTANVGSNVSGKRIAIYGTFKTNNTGEPVRVSTYEGNGVGLMEQVIFTIPPSSDSEVVFLGTVQWGNGAAYIRFENLSPSATIWFDVIALVDASDVGTRMIKIPTVPDNLRAMRMANASADNYPVAQGKRNAGNYFDIPFFGDAWIPINAGTIYVARLARGTNAFWQPATGVPAAVTNTFSIKALEASLVLQ